MERTTQRAYIRWIPTILMMAIIFAFSHAPANVSSETSMALTTTLQLYAQELWGGESVTSAALETMEWVVRKLAHVTEYALLSITICYAYGGMRKAASVGMLQVVGVAILLSGLYAVTDEVHQLFIDGRSGQVRDVVIDTVGATLGGIFYFIVVKLHTIIAKLPTIIGNRRSV
ncbi:MAG: VanZ family protein [Eubacteriales bacterium]